LKYRLFSSKESKKKFLIVLFVFLFFILVFIYFSKSIFSFFNNPDGVKTFVLSFGPWAPVILILLQILQVLIAPIPGQIAGFVSGYIFGVVKGTIYTMIGTVIGSTIAFVVARKFGRPFVEKVIDAQTLKKFDYISSEKGVFALFLIFLLPALPDDAVCYIAGLTKIPIKKLVFITFIGRFPGFLILNMVGSGVANAKTKFAVVLFSIFMVVSFAIYLYRKKLEVIFTKVLKNLRKDSN